MKKSKFDLGPGGMYLLKSLGYALFLPPLLQGFVFKKYDLGEGWVDTLYLIPCPGLNEHPIRDMETILRQGGSHDEIYKSMMFPGLSKLSRIGL